MYSNMLNCFAIFSKVHNHLNLFYFTLIKNYYHLRKIVGLRTYFQKHCLRKFVPKNNPSEKLRKEFPRSFFYRSMPSSLIDFHNGTTSANQRYRTSISTNCSREWSLYENSSLTLEYLDFQKRSIVVFHWRSA